MKKILSTFVLSMASAAGCPAFAAEGIVGRHAVMAGSPEDGLEIILECEKETNCTLTSRTRAVAAPLEDVQVLKDVRPVGNLAQARNALKHAIKHQEQTSRFRGAEDAMSHLRPFLSDNPDVAQCWDLNSPSPDYTLACKFTGSSTEASRVFLFTTLMASCTDVFCRYLIYPMSQVK